ncbi:hypothetical protein [Luedemannella helvata]
MVGRTMPVLWPLALAEANLLLRHPLHLLGAALYVFTFFADLGGSQREAYSWITNTVAIVWGVPTFFAAHLVATAHRRAGGDELLAALPDERQRRTAASLLAAVAPFLVACVAQAMAAAYYALAPVEVERFPLPAELLAGPLCVLGAGLLGVMVSRWAPWPGAPLLAMVVLFAFNLRLRGDAMWLGFYVEFARWGPEPDSPGGWGFIDGSANWHAAYLLALCLLAGAGALAREPRWRGRWVGVGLLCGVAVVATGWAQLP